MVPSPSSSVGWRNGRGNVFPRETDEPRLSRDVEGAAQHRTQPLCWGGDRGVTHWLCHAEKQQGGNETGGERAGFVFLPSACSGEDAPGLRQCPQ